jgi:hypothetical protein
LRVFDDYVAMAVVVVRLDGLAGGSKFLLGGLLWTFAVS